MSNDGKHGPSGTLDELLHTADAAMLRDLVEHLVATEPCLQSPSPAQVALASSTVQPLSRYPDSDGGHTMSADKVQRNGEIYQLKATLKRIRPPIWRRIQVPGEATLGQLHSVLQIVMDWDGYHAWEFMVGGRSFGIPDRDFWGEQLDARETRLDEVVREAKARFQYIYDFGDKLVAQLSDCRRQSLQALGRDLDELEARADAFLAHASADGAGERAETARSNSETLFPASNAGRGDPAQTRSWMDASASGPRPSWGPLHACGSSMAPAQGIRGGASDVAQLQGRTGGGRLRRLLPLPAGIPAQPRQGRDKPPARSGSDGGLYPMVRQGQP